MTKPKPELMTRDYFQSNQMASPSVSALTEKTVRDMYQQHITYYTKIMHAASYRDMWAQPAREPAPASSGSAEAVDVDELALIEREARAKGILDLYVALNKRLPYVHNRTMLHLLTRDMLKGIEMLAWARERGHQFT